MEQRNVGSSGLRVSAIGLGCNNFGWTIDAAASRKVVDRALELGVTLFDTADFYGDPPGHAEEVLGEVLEHRRKDVVLITKFGVPLVGQLRFNNSRSYVLKAVEGSLRRLRTDWIDVYMIHWPDPTTPMEETLRALDTLIESGKIRYIACSNLTTWKIVEAQWTARTHSLNGFIASQNEYSLLSRGIESDLLPALKSYGVGLIPYYPLASGLLTGKYFSGNAADAEGRLSRNFLKLGDRFLADRYRNTAQKLNDFAQARGHTLLELSLSWLASRPMVCSLIAGATRPEQVEANARSCNWQLSSDDLAEVDRICREGGVS
jgi:aryl-alcohol dehydrogenase-like predicted oxidoreductase